MARELTTELMTQEFAKNGVFHGIDNLLTEATLSKQQASEFTAHTYEVMLKKVAEAKSEVHKINAVLANLEQTCRSGMVKQNPMSFNSHTMQREALSRELTAFDGWIISLMESYLTLLFFGNPERANAKPNEIAQSMQALTQKRVSSMNFMLKDPSLFKVG